MISKADDIAIMISAQKLEVIQQKLSSVKTLARICLEINVQDLVMYKTDMLLNSRNRMQTEVFMQVKYLTIKAKKMIKYLGVHLDPKFAF